MVEIEAAEDENDSGSVINRCSLCYCKLLSWRWMNCLVIFVNLACVFGTLSLQQTAAAADLWMVKLWLILGMTRGKSLPKVRDSRFPEALALYEGDREIRFLSNGTSLDGQFTSQWYGLGNYIYVNSTNSSNPLMPITGWGFYTMPDTDPQHDPVTWTMVGFKADDTSQTLTDQKQPFPVPTERGKLVGKFKVVDHSASNCMDKSHFASGFACAFAVLGFTNKIWKYAINCFGVGVPLYVAAQFSPLCIAILLAVNLSIAKNCGYDGIAFAQLLFPCLVVWICCLIRPVLFIDSPEVVGERITTRTYASGRIEALRENIYRVGG